MRKLGLVIMTASFLIIAGVSLTSCCDGLKPVVQEQEETSYSCPMHHYIKGEKGDKCSECGMDLTSDKTEIVD